MTGQNVGAYKIQMDVPTATTASGKAVYLIQMISKTTSKYNYENY
jgi:hypothetical protein